MIYKSRYLLNVSPEFRNISYKE